MSEFVRGVVGKTAIIAAFVLCAALALILAFEYYFVGKFANDFGVYWRVANNPVTEAYFWRGRFPFPYMPTMLVWIAPLAFIPKWPAFILFGALSTYALVSACRPYLTNRALVLTLISPPFIRGLFTGQVSALLAAVMIWACGSKDRMSAGLAFGCIASVKPQMVLMAPLMFVLNRDRDAFFASAISFGIIAATASNVFGAERWFEWMASMDHFHRMVAGTRVIEVGVSPAVIAERFGLPPLPFMILGAIAGGFTVYLCRNMEALEKASAIGLGSLMAAPYALAYDLIVVVPLLAVLAMKGRLLAIVGLAGMLNPLPIIVAFYELTRLAPRERRTRDRVATV